MKVLITGITGFVGSHLAEFLLRRKDARIYGIERWRSRGENIDRIKNLLSVVECDIRDASSVRKIVSEIKPDRIFHLAAQSFVPTSWTAPTETLSTNIVGQLNIFEAVRQENLNPRIQVAGSSEEYGAVEPQDIPIKEDVPLRPLSPYAVSKVGQDLLGYQYFKSYGMHIVRTRGFNHSGPRRGDVFAESNFAKQIAEIEGGLAEPIVYVGNLRAERDYTDVRDMVRAYWMAMDKCLPGEVYNISSGEAHSMRDVLDVLLGCSKQKITVKEDKARMRPSDVPILKGDNSKFVRQTGWKAEISFEEMLKDLLDYWREKVGRTARQ